MFLKTKIRYFRSISDLLGEQVVDESEAKWAYSANALRGRLSRLDGHLSVVADYGKMVPDAEDSVTWQPGQG